MIPHTPRDPWSRLSAAARSASPAGDEAPPYGFATRVAALALAHGGRGGPSFLERFALRALAMASLVAFGSLAFNYRVISEVAVAPGAIAAEELTVVAVNEDTVALVLDFAD